MDPISDFVLPLYRAARESSPDDFRRRALERLRSTFAFSSALWGDARRVESTDAVVPTLLHSANLDNKFLVDWTQARSHDPAMPILMTNPGKVLRVHAPSFFSAQPDVVEITRRYRLQAMSLILVKGLAPSQVHFLSVYRSNPDSICSDNERDWLEHVMPHLTEAWRINIALHSMDRTKASSDDAIAICEASTGLLLQADHSFLKLLSREWSGFDGRHLPWMLWKEGRAHAMFTHLGRQARIDVRRAGELLYLSAHRKTDAESLTPRQLGIARLYAQGLSNKEIAQRLALSPATVRTHLAHVYDRLDVHGKTAMARRLAGLLATEVTGIANAY